MPKSLDLPSKNSLLASLRLARKFERTSLPLLLLLRVHFGQLGERGEPHSQTGSTALPRIHWWRVSQGLHGQTAGATSLPRTTLWKVSQEPHGRTDVTFLPRTISRRVKVEPHGQAGATLLPRTISWRVEVELPAGATLLPRTQSSQMACRKRRSLAQGPPWSSAAPFLQTLTHHGHRTPSVVALLVLMQHGHNRFELGVPGWQRRRNLGHLRSLFPEGQLSAPRIVLEAPQCALALLIAPLLRFHVVHLEAGLCHGSRVCGGVLQSLVRWVVRHP